MARRTRKRSRSPVTGTCDRPVSAWVGESFFHWPPRWAAA